MWCTSKAADACLSATLALEGHAQPCLLPAVCEACILRLQDLHGVTFPYKDMQIPYSETYANNGDIGLFECDEAA